MKRAPIFFTVIAVLALLSFSLAACGGGDDTSTSADSSTATVPEVSVNPDDLGPYPDDVKAEYVKSCTATSDGQKSMCECLFEAFEDTLPYDSFKAINNPTPGETPPAMPQETQDAANACVEDATQN